MYCRNCGKELPDHARFCTYCGAAQAGQGGQTKSGKSFGLIIIIGILAVAVILLLAEKGAENTQPPVRDGNSESSLTSASAAATQPRHSSYQDDGNTYATIASEWSDESYHHGNGGNAAILEFPSGVEDCRSLTFYLQVSGNYGTHFNGDWKVFVRSHGKWKHAADLDFQEPDGYFAITFDVPTDFDAMTAYPTIQGNASYNIYFRISDVYCRP